MRKLLLIGLLSACCSTAAATTLGDLQWQYRLIVVFSPDDNRAAAAADRLARTAGIDERDIAWFVLGGERVRSNLDADIAIDSLRALHDADGFEAVLVGKDGGVKSRQTDHLDIQAFFRRNRSDADAPTRNEAAMSREAQNVLGQPLALCCSSPVTGVHRDGYCHTGAYDPGLHAVCAVVTDEFLQFSAARGNDLMSSRPEFGFPGLEAGDRWCLCASRWGEALAAGAAPRVALTATHEAALEVLDLADLKAHAIDLS